MEAAFSDEEDSLLVLSCNVSVVQFLGVGKYFS